MIFLVTENSSCLPSKFESKHCRRKHAINGDATKLTYASNVNHVNITGCVTQLTDVRLYGNIFDYWTTSCRNKMRVTFHVSRHGRVRVDVEGAAKKTLQAQKII